MSAARRRRRAVMGAGFAAVVATIGAAVAARGGDSADPAIPLPRTTETDETEEPGDASGSPVTTVRPPPSEAGPSTTGVAAASGGRVFSAEDGGALTTPVLGEPTGLRLVMAVSDGLVSLDLDSGEELRQSVPDGVDALEALGSGLFSNVDGQWYRSSWDPVAWPVGEASAVSVPVIAAGPEPDLVWTAAVTYGLASADVVARLESVDGRAVDSLVLPAGYFPVGTSGEGLIVLAPDGDLVSLAPGEEPRPVLEGRSTRRGGGLQEWMLVIGCDDQQNCTTSVYDAATDRETPVPDLTIEEVYDSQILLAPDGRHLALVRLDGTAAVSVVDVGTGAEATAVVASTNEVVWSPDGRWLLVRSAPSLMVVADVGSMGEGELSTVSLRFDESVELGSAYPAFVLAAALPTLAEAG